MNGRVVLKARRITGGAQVTVQRGAHARRYRVGLRRYNRLLDTLVAHRKTNGGYYGRNGFEVCITDVAGLAESRRWAQRYGNPRGKHWRAAA